MLQHRQPHVIPRSQEAEQPLPVFPQILNEYSGQIFKQNSASRELLTVAVLGQIGMTAVSRSAALYGLMKRQMLERMQRVVVNENLDWALRREKMGRMLDQMSQ